MEFYLSDEIVQIGARIVSIPNGMEFYAKLEGSNTVMAPFQFPTGWNSTLTQALSIYNTGKFQFPTGWNSTLHQ